LGQDDFKAGKEKSIVYAKKKGHTHVADLLKANKEGKGAQKSH
jgi:hypothetical protein